jgi:hypothetical protein
MQLTWHNLQSACPAYLPDTIEVAAKSKKQQPTINQSINQNARPAMSKT